MKAESHNIFVRTARSPVLLLIRIYQKWISPVTGNNCRFAPSCSNYMTEAIETHGHLKGMYLGSKRICKCHPWHAGGYDPVPGTDHKTQHNN